MPNNQLTPQPSETELAQIQDIIAMMNAEDEGTAYQPLKLFASINKDRLWVLQQGNPEPIFKTEELEGHIILARIHRAYRASREQRIPSCVSNDAGVTGTVTPELASTVPHKTGQFCSSCSLNQWGTGKDEAGNPTKGKACSERRRLLVLTERFAQPVIVSIPPTSLKKWDAYASELASRKPASSYAAQLTKIVVKMETGEGANQFGTAIFSSVRPLDFSEIMTARNLREAFADQLGKVVEPDLEDATLHPGAAESDLPDNIEEVKSEQGDLPF